MLTSLKLRKKLWGVSSFFMNQKEDAIGTAKAIERYLAKQGIKFSSSLSGQLLTCLMLPDRSIEKHLSTRDALLVFIKVLEQYSQLLSRVSYLQNIEPVHSDNCLFNVSQRIHGVSLIETLLERNFSATDFFNHDQVTLFGKTIELLMKVSNNLKKLQSIEEKMKIADNGLLSLIKHIESGSMPQQPLVVNPLNRSITL